MAREVFQIAQFYQLYAEPYSFENQPGTGVRHNTQVNLDEQIGHLLVRIEKMVKTAFSF